MGPARPDRSRRRTVAAMHRSEPTPDPEDGATPAHPPPRSRRHARTAGHRLDGRAQAPAAQRDRPLEPHGSPTPRRSSAGRVLPVILPAPHVLVHSAPGSAAASPVRRSRSDTLLIGSSSSRRSRSRPGTVAAITALGPGSSSGSRRPRWKLARHLTYLARSSRCVAALRLVQRWAKSRSRCPLKCQPDASGGEWDRLRINAAPPGPTESYRTADMNPPECCGLL